MPKRIFLSDNGVEFSFQGVTEKTVGEFLDAHQLPLREKETVFPPLETTLTPGMKIFVARTHEIAIEVDGAKRSFSVHATSVGEALLEAGVTTDEDDIVKPERGEFASRNMVITITRVKIEEQVVEKAVAFEKKTNEDDDLSWRKTVVTQKGEKGLDRLVYRVSTHDGKEVNRKLVRTERVKEPVTEIVTQGTEVKLGKSHTGGASWYAWTGTLAAANPWLPKGSYVKVTNLENGKSVIVVINDRGPFVPGRIIDLDKVAFAKIASVGAGVINVKMEEITN
ncbi:MAG: G5 domain-containing protein [Candidatus Moranbacteria bacterium]|nr:G5 domain-containing protein [Candidatus Moranbacteria bacterium]